MHDTDDTTVEATAAYEPRENPEAPVAVELTLRPDEDVDAETLHELTETVRVSVTCALGGPEEVGGRAE